ncbi:MAG: Crp/Fnr family transcriptional regulator [Pseudomonas sp.]
MGTPYSIEETLRLVPWIGACDQALVSALAGQSRQVSLREGESLARRGRSLDNLMVVSDGEVELSMTGRSGKRHVIGHLQRGQIFGLIPVMDGGSVIHDADAVQTSAVILVPRDALLKGLQQSHALTTGLITALCQRSRRIYDFLADQSLLTMTGRVARLLLSLLTIYDSSGTLGTGHASIHLSQSSLSDMLAVSRQSLNAELKKLERLNLIKISYSRIEVVDTQGLEQLIELDTMYEDGSAKFAE